MLRNGKRSIEKNVEMKKVANAKSSEKVNMEECNWNNMKKKWKKHQRKSIVMCTRKE